jgi:hypothetical protein
MQESYTSRPMWLTKETTYAIERDGLHVRVKDGQSRMVPWHKMESVRVNWAQAKNQPRVYFCQIKSKGEMSPSVHFSQLQFQGMLSFIDHSVGYNKFVRALTARIADDAPHVKFWTGPGYFERLIISCVVGALAAIALTFGALGLTRIIHLDGMNMPMLLLTIGAGLGWLGWKLYGWNAPKPIDPRNIPSDILAPIRG